jgi:acid phosphatase (class A)
MGQTMRTTVVPSRLAKVPWHGSHGRFSAVTVAAALSVLVAGAGLSTSVANAQSATVPEIRPGILQGYLPAEVLPNSLTMVPSPPSSGSAALALDEEVSRESLGLRGTPRWQLAAEDADLMFPHAAGTFSCALNAPITEQDTPRLYMLMRRSLTDAGLSTYAAKSHYKRVRPFVLNKEPTCTPDKEAQLRNDGSYPSGHAAVGWAWALILSEIAPDRTDAILKRGLAFGQSRLVCNAQWESDVIEGRLVGAAAVARLHGDSTFSGDLAAAKIEFTAARAKGDKAMRDCQAEAGAMALDPPRAP